MGDYIRTFSESQFNKDHCLPSDQEFSAKKDVVTASLLDVKVGPFELREAEVT